jgi:hypothetical protein
MCIYSMLKQLLATEVDPKEPLGLLEALDRLYSPLGLGHATVSTQPEAERAEPTFSKNELNLKVVKLSHKPASVKRRFAFPTK